MSKNCHFSYKFVLNPVGRKILEFLKKGPRFNYKLDNHKNNFCITVLNDFITFELRFITSTTCRPISYRD